MSIPLEPGWAVHQCVVLVLCLCSSTESEQKADKDGGAVFLGVIVMVGKQRIDE